MRTSDQGQANWMLEERLLGYLDIGAEGVLRALNSLEAVESTSSCIGRASIVEAEYPWERRDESRIIYKSHSGVTPEELSLVIARFDTTIWLKVTGPIVHLRVDGLDCASKILEVARGAGFKHSGLISVTSEGYVLEIHSPTQLIVPLRIKGAIVVRGESLKALASKANEILLEGRKRLARLLVKLEDPMVREACSGATRSPSS